MSGHGHGILPEERTRDIPLRWFGAAALACLLAGLLLNGAVFAILKNNPALENPTFVAFEAQWRRLMDLAEPVDTLILGDSSGRHGVDPAVLDEALETRSLNLCTMGDAAVINPAWQLETYLETHAPPRRVILVAVHDLWKRRIRTALVPRVPLPWAYWNGRRAPWDHGAGQWAVVFLARFAPLYSQDRTVTDLLAYPWRREDRRLVFSNKGFNPIRRADPARVVRDRSSQIKYSAPAGWHISRQSLDALDAMIAMAVEHGFDLYICNAPQAEEMIDDPAFGPYYAKGQGYLAGRAAEQPRVHLILSPPPQYAPGVMQISDHIVASETAGYTRLIAAAVADLEQNVAH